jgi:glycosyltransferase involved in cell wall biosynthesis
MIQDLFRAQAALHRQIPWVPIADMSEAQVASVLAESTIFLSIPAFSSIGLTTLEAMAAGCFSVGFAGQGREEYATSRNGFWAPEGDCMAVADQLARAVHHMRQGGEPFQDTALNVLETGRQYARARSAAPLGHFWREALPADDRIPVRWVGDQFNYFSLALVNRELCAQLAASGEVALETHTLHPPDFDPQAAPRYRALDTSRVTLTRPAAVHVRHAWPPDFTPPAEGAWVVVQPWEFGGLPDAWIGPLRDQVDELWCYTHWLKDCAVKSGVPPEKIRVVPCGVDAEFYRPDGPRYPLKTKKRFKFLFLGGMLPRKGADIAVNAFLRAFKPDDDVCLVVKAFGVNTHYRNAKSLPQQIEALSRRYPEVPEIEYLDEDVTDEEIAALYRACDALVHPFRGEGFGLPIAEAMASGLPVLVTGYGPVLDFCDAESAYMIPCVETPVETAQAAAAGSWMVEPDQAALSALMRQVYEAPEAARAVGERGRSRIVQKFSWQQAGAAALQGIRRLASAPPLRFRGASRATAEVVWHGVVFNPSGYADETRNMVTGLRARGASIALRVIGAEAPGFRAGLAPGIRAELETAIAHPVAPGAISVMAAPAYAFQRLAGATYHIGRTMFETDSLPPAWVERCNTMDELWVPTEFNIETFRRAGVTTRITKVPGGIDHHMYRPGLAPLPITGARGTVFLSVFTWDYRKGWDVLLRAWARAFGPEDEVSLVLRTYPHGRSDAPGAYAQINTAIDQFLQADLGLARSAIAPIIVLTDQISEDDLPRLYAAAQAYVAPSRGEGWGRPQMEAMASGLPVIATNWSGTTEFLNEHNSLPLNTEGLVTIDARGGFEFDGQRWAEPSAEHLVSRLRQVVASPEAAAALGRRARADVERLWGWEQPLAIMQARLSSIQAELASEARRVASSPTIENDSSRPTVLLLSTHPYQKPIHGGQVRLAMLAKSYEAAGFAVCGIAVCEPDGYAPSHRGPHDLDFPKDSPHRLFEGEPALLINDLLAGRFAAADDGGYPQLLNRLPDSVDVVHVEQPWLWPVARRLKTTPQCRGAVFVYGSENVEEPLKRSIFGMYGYTNEPALQAVAAVEREACREADVALAVTQADMAYLVGCGAAHPLLVPNGISPWMASEAKLAEWRQKLPRSPWILYVASAHAPNFTGFADCVGDSLACIPPDSALVLAGAVGPYLADRLMKSPSHELNRSRLRVLGVLSDEDLAAVKTLAHAYMLPIQEGGGSNIKTAEALYSGAFVVGTPTSFRGFEPFTEAERVFVAPTPEAFQASIREVLAQDSRKPLSEAAEAERMRLRWEHGLRPLPEFVKHLLATRKMSRL